MKKFVRKICFFSIFLNLVLYSHGQKPVIQKQPVPGPSKITIIKFDPSGAIDFPFDSLVKSVNAIELQTPAGLNASTLLNLARTDSFFVAYVGYSYRIFDLTGKFLKDVGSTGDGANSLRSLFGHFADNKSILSVYQNKWIKYALDGSIIQRGVIPYQMHPNSLMPLSDSIWLFYTPHLGPDDTSRLWSTDLNFNIKKRYLHSDKHSPTGGMGFMKYIYPTSNGIYITDRVVDTIYRFTEKAVDPVYVFDSGSYKYYRTFEMRRLSEDEITTEFKLVSANAVLFKVLTRDRSYFIYHNRITKITKTIKTITNGPDLINSWILKGFDNKDRLFWRLVEGSDTLINAASKKVGYTSLLERRKVPFSKANPIIIITTLK